MNWVCTLIIIACDAFIVFIATLFIKNFFPSYMNEKGKNLATKEDIQEITKKTEEIQSEFKQQFELFSSDVRFKYSFYYEQYSKLYCKLYAIIAQSEYVRRYILLTKNEKYSFDEEPFFEILPIHRVAKKATFDKELGFSMKCEEFDIETPISQFNKKEMCDYIINNGQYASQELLKLAVSYRFAYSRYSGNSEGGGKLDETQIADVEEARLLKEIVCCIVSEYNFYRKELKMSYIEQELENELPSL